jgi:arginase
VTGHRFLRVPYHIDEHLPDLDLPLPAGQVITARPQAGDVWGRLARLYTAVADAVVAAVRDGGCPVVVSGDCTTALGTMCGLQRAGVDPGIVWIDAHGDVQTLETTASGYLGGLPLRLLAGYRPELIAGRLSLRPVPEERIVLAGARDLDPPEAEYLARALIRQASLDGLAAVLPSGPLHVHVDLDIIDPGWLPGLRYPAPGGASPAEVSDVLRGLLGAGRVAALDIACTWHPGHGAAARVGPHLEAAIAEDPGLGED